MMIKCVNFCVDELLWMLSWGWYQLAFGFVFSWLGYMFLGRMKTVPAIVLAVASYSFAMMVYFAFVAGLFLNYFQTSFVPGQAPHVYNSLYASLFLGLIFSFLQLIFYSFIYYWRRSFHIVYFSLLALLCNILAAFAAAACIKITF